MNTTQRVSRTQLLVGIAVVIIVAELFANVIDVGGNDSGDDNGSVGGWIGLSVFGIVVTALLLHLVVPRLGGNRQTVALVLAVLAVITCVVFWSALPFAFGAAAIAAAGPGDGGGPAPSGGAATAAKALAAIAIVAAFVFCIIG